VSRRLFHASANIRKAFLAMTVAGILPLCPPASADAAVPARQDSYLAAISSLSESREEEASSALTRMIEQEPQNAGAWLDLALIQCELGRADEAERLFSMIESQFAPPPGIREVIANRRASGCKGWQARSQLGISLTRGSDNNVNQGASNPSFSIGSGETRTELTLQPEYLPLGDQFTQLSIDYARNLNRRGTVGFAQLRVRQNDTLSQYNTSSLRGGFEHPWEIGAWRFTGTGSLGMLTLGNQLYQRQGVLQARMTPPLKLGEAFQLHLLTGASRLEYATLDRFDSTTLEAGAQLNYQRDNAGVQASGGYLYDRGASNRLGGNREGWFAGLQGKFSLPAGISAELGWTRQHWKGEVPYSPGLIDQIRQQNTHLLRAAMILPVRPGHALSLEWRQVHNNENISLFQYRSRLIQLSWQWQPF
jgi:hypothetical protein